jgi:hypothetical protein
MLHELEHAVMFNGTPSSIADACEALGGDLCFGSEWDVTKRTNGEST